MSPVTEICERCCSCTVIVVVCKGCSCDDKPTRSTPPLVVLLAPQPMLLENKCFVILLFVYDFALRGTKMEIMKLQVKELRKIYTYKAQKEKNAPTQYRAAMGLNIGVKLFLLVQCNLN